MFEGYEAVVTPSASCAGMVREQLGAEAPPVHELSEFLVDVLGVEDVGAYYPHRVTYHPTCHSLRGLHLGDRPAAAALGRARDGPRRAARCARVLRVRRNVRGEERGRVDGDAVATRSATCSTRSAEVVCAVDSSCLMHIGGGLSRGRTGVRTVHLAEILASTEDEPWP